MTTFTPNPICTALGLSIPDDYDHNTQEVVIRFMGHDLLVGQPVDEARRRTEGFYRADGVGGCVDVSPINATEDNVFRRLAQVHLRHGARKGEIAKVARHLRDHITAEIRERRNP